MPIVNTHIFTHHSPENLLSLVSDIARYPEFIKWIKAMRVSNEKFEGDETHRLGEALVGFKGFSEKFATNVKSSHKEKTVQVTLVRGPFRHLKNIWKFTANPEGVTRVDFHIDYAFSNPILAMLARSNTDSAIARIMQSFVEEADKRYGLAPQSS